MATIDYPEIVLPAPLISLYSYKDVTRRIRTDMDNGYARERRRFTKAPTRFNFSLSLDQGALSYFEAWYAEVLLNGLEWFNMPIAIGDGRQSISEVRFLGEPAISANSDRWNVSATIETVNKNLGILYDDVTLGLIASLGGFDQASASFDQFDFDFNVSLPIAVP